MRKDLKVIMHITIYSVILSLVVVALLAFKLQTQKNSEGSPPDQIAQNPNEDSKSDTSLDIASTPIPSKQPIKKENLESEIDLPLLTAIEDEGPNTRELNRNRSPLIDKYPELTERLSIKLLENYKGIKDLQYTVVKKIRGKEFETIKMYIVLPDNDPNDIYKQIQSATKGGSSTFEGMVRKERYFDGHRVESLLSNGTFVSSQESSDGYHSLDIRNQREITGSFEGFDSVFFFNYAMNDQDQYNAEQGMQFHTLTSHQRQLLINQETLRPFCSISLNPNNTPNHTQQYAEYYEIQSLNFYFPKIIRTVYWNRKNPNQVSSIIISEIKDLQINKGLTREMLESRHNLEN